MDHRSRPNSRDRILDAAAEIVAEVGAGRLTLDAVAERCGLSKGGVLYNFRSKDELLRGMIDRMVEEALADKARRKAEIAGRRNAEARAGIGLRCSLGEGQREIAFGLLAAVSENPALLDPVRRLVAADWAALRAAEDPDASMIAWLAAEGLHSLDLFRMDPLSEDDRARVMAALERLLDGGLAAAAAPAAVPAAQ